MNEENKIFIEEDEIDLFELWDKIWKNRKFILVICSVVVILTAIISLIMDNIYRSTATLIPISSSNNSLSAYAGLAAMAGINLPVGGGDDNAKIQAILKSRSLKEAVIKKTRFDKNLK